MRNGTKETNGTTNEVALAREWNRRNQSLNNFEVQNLVRSLETIEGSIRDMRRMVESAKSTLLREVSREEACVNRGLGVASSPDRKSNEKEEAAPKKWRRAQLIEAIFDFVAEEHNCTRGDILGKTRSQWVTEARWCSLHLLNLCLGLKVTAIANLLGRQVTFVRSALQSYRQQLETDSRVKDACRRIGDRINEHTGEEVFR